MPVEQARVKPSTNGAATPTKVWSLQRHIIAVCHSSGPSPEVAAQCKKVLFLEIQRGGWESRRAYQKSHPDTRQFAVSANAFELIKVYGAGWMREPGTAFGKNATFTPGTIFRRITSGDDSSFGVEDLHAGYRLKCVADELRFGRGATDPSRRQTRFLFYYVICDLLTETLMRGQLERAPKDITNAVLAVFGNDEEEAGTYLSAAASEVISEYLSQDSDDSLYKEPGYQGDLNTFLKWEQLGKNDESTPLFKSLLSRHKNFFGRGARGEESPRSLVLAAIRRWEAKSTE